MLEKNKAGFYIFVFVICVFVFGGYGLLYYSRQGKLFDSNDEKIEAIVSLVDNRIDKSYEYVYFDNLDYPMEKEKIVHSDIIINIKGFGDLEDQLNSEVLKQKDNVVMVSDVTTSEDVTTFPNDEGIYSLMYREYEVIEYEDYISIIVKDFEYNIVSVSVPTMLSVYIIDKSDATIISEDELLKLSSVSLDDVKNMISDKLNTSDSASIGVNKEESMNNLNYAIYVNKVGKLEVSYKVISTNGDFYDKLVIN